MSIKRYDHFIKVYTKSFVDVTGARYVYPDAGMAEGIEGKYVEYDDYARIKDEKNRGTAQYNGIIDTQLKAIDELKAEVKRLTAEKDQAECDYDNCQKRLVRIDNCRCDLFMENKNLKAEVQRLKSHSFTAYELTSMKAEAELLHAQFKRDLFNQLIQENERLRKAGNELERVLASRSGSYEAGNASHEWQSAKNYKPNK